LERARGRFFALGFFVSFFCQEKNENVRDTWDGQFENVSIEVCIFFIYRWIQWFFVYLLCQVWFLVLQYIGCETSD
jgi:hypothetical protein